MGPRHRLHEWYASFGPGLSLPLTRPAVSRPGPHERQKEAPLNSACPPAGSRPLRALKVVRLMKTVLFCGGLGTRIRDYSENIPKPMIPVGDKPILWHLMSYYSQYGHRISSLPRLQGERHQGVFPQLPAAHLRRLRRLRLWRRHRNPRRPQRDWRITMIDTGIWRNIGERLFAVRIACRGRGDVSCQLQRWAC